MSGHREHKSASGHCSLINNPESEINHETV